MIDRHALGSQPDTCTGCFDYRTSPEGQRMAADSPGPTTVLKQLISIFDGAMATEHVDPEVRRRVINLLLVGVTDPNAVIEVPNGGR